MASQLQYSCLENSMNRGEPESIAGKELDMTEHTHTYTYTHILPLKQVPPSSLVMQRDMKQLYIYICTFLKKVYSLCFSMSKALLMLCSFLAVYFCKQYLKPEFYLRAKETSDYKRSGIIPFFLTLTQGRLDVSTVNSLCWNLLSAPGGVYWFTGVPGGSHHKEATCNAGDAGAVGLFSGSGRFLGEGNGCSLQYSRLENSIDRLSPWDSQRVGHN